MRRPPAVLAALVVGAIAATLFDRILFRGEALFERDILSLVYVQAETFVRCLASGAWPVWDPYPGFGQPMLANPGAQVLYPWTWLNLLCAPATAYTIYVVGHLFLSGLGFERLGRRFGLSPAGALFAAAVWCASGPFLSLVDLWQHFAGAAWIPWVLLAADAALGRPGIARALVWGAAVAGQMLAGSVELCAATLLLEAGLVGRALARPSPAPSRRAIGGTVVLGALTALALAAGQWLPAALLLPGSSRADLPGAIRTYWSLHPLTLVQCLLPVLPRDLPLLPETRDRLFEGREPFLGSLYLGLGSLAFVGAAVARRGRARLVRWLAALALGAVIFALGRHTAVHAAAIALLPPLGIFRFPVKAIVLAAFAWALLAGLGHDALRSEGPRARTAALVAGPPLVIALALGLACLLSPERLAPHFMTEDGWGRTFAQAVPAAGRSLLVSGALAAAALALVWLGRAPGIAAAAALAVVDLVAVHRPLNPSAPRGLLFDPPPILAPLARDGLSRLYSFDYLRPLPGKVYRRPPVHAPIPPAYARLPPLLRTTLALRGALPAPMAQGYGAFGSYDWDVLSLFPAALRDLAVLLRAQEETPGFHRLLRIGAVTHVVALHTEGLEDLERIASVGGPEWGGTIHAFRVADTLPRAYAVGSTVRADGVDALSRLLDPAFDPARQVVLAEGTPRAMDPAFTSKVAIRSFRADHVVLDAELSAPGHVVLVDAWDAGWRAAVDGRPAPVLRGNVAFRAVEVPAGRHVVDFAYRPPAARVGLAVSGLALLAVAAGVVWDRRRAAPPADGPP